MRKEWMKDSRSKAEAVFLALRPAAALVARARAPRTAAFFCAAIKNIFCALLVWYCLPVGLFACLVRVELYKQNRQKATGTCPTDANEEKRLRRAA